MDMLTQFQAARRVSTPLIAIRTSDPAATIAAICNAIPNDAPRYRWDIQNGLLAMNDQAKKELSKLLNGADQLSATGSPGDCLGFIQQASERALIFFLNANRTYDSSDMARALPVIQGIWNLREPFKQNERTLVMLSPEFKLPPEISQDVLVLDEPLPDAARLETIVRETWKQGHEDKKITDDVCARAVDAVRGLAAFSAEQVIAMSLKSMKENKEGIDVDALWTRKRELIEQTPGLAVPVFKETFDGIGGCSNVKFFVKAYNRGPQKPRVYVFMDEIEKALAGAAGDTSGVSADFLGTLLSYMQDKDSTGMIFVGPPGAAKSMVAKAAGNDAGVPTIQFDVGAMKGSFVGQSEQAIRAALKIISAVSDDRACFIATCNRISVLPPELKRRFNLGTFFFDLPSAEEREQIWDTYLRAYNVTPKRGESVNDDNWTGAEIRNCVKTAFLLNCSLKDASAFVVPAFRSMGNKLDELRADADGKYINAAKPGFYESPIKAEQVSAGRKLNLTGVN